jgi:hypothetical protein
MMATETINGKKCDEMTYTDWTAVEGKQEAERLRVQVLRQIEYCREKLARAERELNRLENGFYTSSGILGGAGTELDALAAQYSITQNTAAKLIFAVEHDYRKANPGPGEHCVALMKFFRVAFLGLPALPQILVYSYREPDKARMQWAVALGDRDAVIVKGLQRAQAEERAQSEAKQGGGLAVKVDEQR